MAGGFSRRLAAARAVLATPRRNRTTAALLVLVLALAALVLSLSFGLRSCGHDPTAINGRPATSAQVAEKDESSPTSETGAAGSAATTTEANGATTTVAQVALTQSSDSGAVAAESRAWLFSSQPKGVESFAADWHIVLTGSLEAGSISIPEDETAKGTYQATGDRLLIDLSRFQENPQKFHYEMTGYPGDEMEGTLLIGRLNASEPEWRAPVPARATQ